MTDSDADVQKAAFAFFDTLPDLDPVYENAGIDPTAPPQPKVAQQ